MGTEDKLYKKIQQAAENAETNTFPGMEKVWARVEEKLDKKEDRNAIVLWKKVAIAASLLVFITIGYQVTKKEEIIIKPENTIVKEDKRENPLENNTETVVENEMEKPEIDKEKIDAIFSKKNEVQSFIGNGQKEEEPAIVKNTTSQESIENATIRQKTLLTAPDTTKVITQKSEPIVEITSNNNIIKGVVSDTFGPTPSVTIFIKGTNIGTTTNFNGEFQIPAKKGDQLVFNYVGMKPKTVKIGESNNLTVALEEDVSALEAVVVVGYGTKRKKVSTSSSLTSIAPQQMSNRPNTTMLQSLQGSVAGVNISSSNGAPGSSNNVVIRGAASLKGNNNPLYVINGIPVENVELSNLNPNNIESVEVLKDAAATSLYGSRASNGIILIKTKDKLSKRQLKKLLKEKINTEVVENEKIKVEISQEEYESFIENPFTNPKTEPLSTFSIDVDNASYTNIRRFINQGQTVPKDAVRVEEMINFFKYDYNEPENEHPFAIETEYSDCPWNANHKLVKIGLQGKNIEDKNLPASNFVYLIDVSGSMSDVNKLPLLKQSVKVLVDKMREEDKVSIVVYAGAAGLVLPPTSGNEKETILNAFEKLNAGGSTAGGQGIELAYKIAQENFIKGGNNRVILATDGDFNVGASSDKDMETLIEEKRKSGVFLTCLGFGMNNYKDSKMEILADKGNGNYAYIDNIQEANRFLGKEFKGSMFAIAKDVKIQIEFNPKHVQSYRLIGYENRKLRPEDFKNDAIDAGELGSGHTVTALYEIIPTGIKSNYPTETDALKYTTNETKSDKFTNELATVKFRYKKPDGDKSIEMIQVIENNSIPIENASEDFKFASAVAWFGLKLRDSKLIENKASEAIIELAKKGKSRDEEGYKAEFIRLVEALK